MIYSLADFSDSANYQVSAKSKKSARIKIYLKFKQKNNENHKNIQR